MTEAYHRITTTKEGSKHYLLPYSKLEGGSCVKEENLALVSTLFIADVYEQFVKKAISLETLKIIYQDYYLKAPFIVGPILHDPALAGTLGSYIFVTEQNKCQAIVNYVVQIRTCGTPFTVSTFSGVLLTFGGKTYNLASLPSGFSTKYGNVLNDPGILNYSLISDCCKDDCKDEISINYLLTVVAQVRNTVSRVTTGLETVERGKHNIAVALGSLHKYAIHYKQTIYDPLRPIHDHKHDDKKGAVFIPPFDRLVTFIGQFHTDRGCILLAFSVKPVWVDGATFTLLEYSSLSYCVPWNLEPLTTRPLLTTP